MRKPNLPFFYARLIWVENEAPKGSKIESFWLEGLYQFQYIWDVKSESDIIFQVHPIWEAKIGPPKRGVNLQKFEIIFIAFSIFLGMPNLNLPLFFMSDPFGG